MHQFLMPHVTKMCIFMPFLPKNVCSYRFPYRNKTSLEIKYKYGLVGVVSLQQGAFYVRKHVLTVLTSKLHTLFQTSGIQSRFFMIMHKSKQLENSVCFVMYIQHTKCTLYINLLHIPFDIGSLSSPHPPHTSSCYGDKII